MDHRTNSRYHGKQNRNTLFLLAAAVLLASLLFYLFASLSLRKFAAFPAIVGGFLALFGLAATLSPKAGALLRRVLWVGATLLLAGFLMLEAVIMIGDRTEITQEPDVVVILGAQVHAWGPSVLLADRLDTAYDYLEDHPDLPVIVSGGQGSDEPTTEAVAMRDYLVDKGLDGERIWLEEKSHNTNENLIYSKELLLEKGLKPEETHLLVVSNGFHLARVRMLAQRQGLDISTLSAPSSHFSAKVQSYLREAPALVKSWIFDR